MPHTQPLSPAQMKSGNIYLALGAVMLASGMYAGVMSGSRSWLVLVMLGVSVILFAMAISPLVKQYLHGNSHAAKTVPQTESGNGAASNISTAPVAETAAPPEAVGRIDLQTKTQVKPQVVAKIETLHDSKPAPPSNIQSELQPVAKKTESGNEAANDTGISPMAEAVPDHEAVERIEPTAETLVKPHEVTKSEALPGAKAVPQPAIQSERQPVTKIDVATLMNMTLGEILLTSLLKDPESVGRIIVQAVTEAESLSPSPDHIPW